MLYRFHILEIKSANASQLAHHFSRAIRQGLGRHFSSRAAPNIQSSLADRDQGRERKWTGLFGLVVFDSEHEAGQKCRSARSTLRLDLLCNPEEHLKHHLNIFDSQLA